LPNALLDEEVCSLFYYIVVDAKTDINI